MSRLPFVVLIVAAVARAQPAPDPAQPSETIVIVDHGPRGGTGELTSDDPEARDRRRGLAGSEFVTVIHVDERAGETRGVAEAVGATAGADVRVLGGLGSFASIAVRGASPGHTQVSIDGVPLSRLGSVTADLSRYELDSFDEVALYRGAVPVTLGGAGVGGALDLVTRVGRAATGERWRVTLGAGSYGARSGRVRFGDGDPDDGAAITAEAGYAGARGDYRFFDDGGTSLDASDDRTSTRANNGYDEVDALLRAAGTSAAGDRRWAIGARAVGKRQGVPGTGWDQALHTRLDTAGGTVDGHYAIDQPRAIDGLAIRGTSFATIEWQAFRDPDDEIGLASEDRRYLTLGGGAQASATYRRACHRLAAALELRGDHYRDREVGAAAPLATAGDRVGGAIAISDDVGLHAGRIAIEPALRLEALHTAPLVDASAGMPRAAPPRDELLWSPRLAARALVTPDLAVKASAGRYARVPTALELFGDRGFIVGRPDLRTEHGWSGDLGAVFAPSQAVGAFDRIYLELAGFAARPTDVIALVTTGGLVTRPVNLAGADLYGVELAATMRVKRALSLTGNYTWLDARQRSSQASLDGKQLPGRPAHAVYLRADAARRWRGRQASIYGDAAFTTGAFLDEANLNQIPRRLLLGAGAKVELHRMVAVGLEVKNLADQRVEDVALDPPPRPDLTEVPRALADLAGYPLPGRAFYLRIDFTY